MKDFHSIIVLSVVALIAIIAMIMTVSINSNTVGLAVHPLYPAFSAPEPGFTVNGNSLSVSDDAVYKTGYYSVNGGAWQSFTLSGTTLGGSWLTGTATKTLPSFGTGEHYVVIYSCNHDSGSWDCYGNRWQLQIINNAVSTCSGSTTQSCTITNGAGTQSRTCNSGVWSGWNTCTVTSCNSGYTKSGNTCVSTSQTGSCTNRVRDGAEIGVDCGGSCDACASGRTFYVAVNGKDTNPGTFEQPWATWQKGFTEARAGDIVYIRGGTYHPDTIDQYGVSVSSKSGTVDNKISILNYPGEIPILDCSTITSTLTNVGIYMDDCFYWVLKGLNVINVLQHELDVQPSGFYMKHCGNMRFEQFNTYNIEGVGWSSWANLGDVDLINCDSYNNYDIYSAEPGNQGDGFVVYEDDDPSVTVTFYGCRAWNCADDGYDTYWSKSKIIYDYCWAFNIGYNNDPELGSGFKCGQVDGIHPTAWKTYTNCIASNCTATGWVRNNGNIKIDIFNSMAYKCGWQGGFSMALEGQPVDELVRLMNNIAFNNTGEDYHWYDESNQISNHNTWDDGAPTLSAADFVSLDVSQLARPRKADGSLPDITFGHLASGSDLINAGVNVGLNYSGSAPDLGPFETR